MPDYWETPRAGSGRKAPISALETPIQNSQAKPTEIPRTPETQQGNGESKS